MQINFFLHKAPPAEDEEEQAAEEDGMGWDGNDDDLTLTRIQM